jgi:ABC-type multidrug transport system fused ATPase/permease subunit
LSQDGEFFDKHPTTELVTRLSNDPSSVSAAIDQRLAECLQGATALVVGIGVAFIFDYKMAFFGIFTPLITVAIQIVLMNALKNQIRKDSELAKETSRVRYIKKDTRFILFYFD